MHHPCIPTNRRPHSHETILQSLRPFAPHRNCDSETLTPLFSFQRPTPRFASTAGIFYFTKHNNVLCQLPSRDGEGSGIAKLFEVGEKHLFEGDEVAVSKFKRRRWDAFLRGERRASVRRRRRKKTKEYGLGMVTLNPWDWWKPCLG